MTYARPPTSASFTPRPPAQRTQTVTMASKSSNSVQEVGDRVSEHNKIMGDSLMAKWVSGKVTKDSLVSQIMSSFTKGEPLSYDA